MASKKAVLRSNALSRRAAKLRRQGHTISEIAEATGIPRGRVEGRIILGERLLSVEPDGSREVLDGA